MGGMADSGTLQATEKKILHVIVLADERLREPGAGKPGDLRIF